MKKVYLDSCIYIYHFESHPQFASQAVRFFSDAEKGLYRLVASPLTLHEIMSGVYQNAEINSDELYSFLTTFPGIDWIDFSLEIADLSASLRAKTKIKTPDAIHLATAIRSSCTHFVTNDKELARKKFEQHIKFSVI